MRILYTLMEDLRPQSGGMLHFRAVADHLARQSHDVFVLAGQYGLGTSLRREARRSRWHSMFLVLPRVRFIFLVFQFLSALLLPLIVLMHRPQVLIVRGSAGLYWLVQWVARRLGLRVVMELNGVIWEEMAMYRLPGFFRPIGLKTTDWLCRTADAIAAVTPGIGRELQNRFAVPEQKLFVVQNGASPEEIPSDPVLRHTVRKKWGVGPADLLLGFIGTFEPWWGLEEMLEALDRLPSDLQARVKLMLAGHGMQNARVARWTANSNRVLLPGPMGRAEVRRTLAALDAGLMVIVDPRKTRYGTSPLKFWEFAAAGLPIICHEETNLTPLVRRYEMGLVVDDLSAAGIARAIEAFAERRAYFAQRGCANRTLVAEKLSWSHTARRMAYLAADDWPVEDDPSTVRCGPLAQID
jgi:glycosyltransferase involved in cell wall biosynthesis